MGFGFAFPFSVEPLFHTSILEKPSGCSTLKVLKGVSLKSFGYRVALDECSHDIQEKLRKIALQTPTLSI